MPNRTILGRGFLLALALLMPIVGCGRQANSEIAPVSGKVSYQGRPLHTGIIVFSPDSARGNSGELARAEIQADGSYRLQSGDRAGTLPGCYRVTVMAIEPGSAASPPHSLLPPKYRDPELSGLSCEVTAGRENTINFNLK